jgi:hypothetical protein
MKFDLDGNLKWIMLVKLVFGIILQVNNSGDTVNKSLPLDAGKNGRFREFMLFICSFQYKC